MLNRIIGHESIKLELKKIIDKIPPVIIFNGPPKVGKTYTALHYIDEMYYGNLTCRLLNHPDIHLYTPDTSTFKIELIKQLTEAVLTTPFELNKKFHILRDIDKMNKESFNRCLKILEDRNDSDYFILTTTDINLIPKTVISRSNVFNFAPISNLKEYFPHLTDLQLKLTQGCIGKISILENIDLTNLYKQIKCLLESIKNLSYAEILEQYNLIKDTDYSILIDMLSIVALELSDIKVLQHIRLLKDNLKYSILPELQIKNALLSLK